jgi:hypothetical protein
MQLSRLPPRSVAFGIASTAWRLATSRGMAAGLAAVRVERLKGVRSRQREAELNVRFRDRLMVRTMAELGRKRPSDGEPAHMVDFSETLV